MLNLKEVGVINLEQMYLVAIIKVLEAEKLQAVLQDFDNGAGRLWLVREGTTVPQAEILFKFDRDAVTIGVQSRDERKIHQEVKYAEGIDGFLERLQKFLRAGLIEHKTGPSTKPAAKFSLAVRPEGYCGFPVRP